MKDPLIPQFVVDSEIQITLEIPPTDAKLENQGYTYNQAGFTYNQTGVMYGGVYQINQDVAPIFFNDSATLLNPLISSIIDAGTQIASPNHQKTVGVGWWMYVSQQ